MKNSHWTISAKKNALRNIVLRKMICPFWPIPLEIPLFFLFFFGCSQRSVFGEMEGLSMLLERLAYPCRYRDMIPGFGRPVPEMHDDQCCSRLDLNEHGHHLTDFNQPFLSRASLRTYADAIHQKGAALNTCWDFVDGTVRVICRPLQNQRIVYNGHKRVHALKFQSIVAPNGLIANLYGPLGE